MTDDASIRPSHSMDGKVCVVTGATSGIGEATALELARRRAKVVLVGRDEAKCRTVQERIRFLPGNPDSMYLVADLSLMAEVRQLAQRILAENSRIDVLINNAGAVFARRQLTSEGLEKTFALNVLSPFLLTLLLEGRLRTSAPARVVNVASAAHRGTRIDFENFFGERRYSAFGVYGESKLALLMVTYGFAQRLQGTGVTVNALHPGFVATRFGHDNPGLFGRVIAVVEWLAAIRVERGAERVAYLASDAEVATITGQYYVRSRPHPSSPESYDSTATGRLWEMVYRLSGLPN